MSELDQTLSEAAAETRLFVESTVDLDADLLATLARSRATASAMEPEPSRPPRGAHIALATAAALVALLLGVLTVIDRGDSGVEPVGTISPSPSRTLPTASTIVESPIVPASTVAPATSTGSTSAGDGSAFAAAIEASGVLTSPSADEAAQATDAPLRGEHRTNRGLGDRQPRLVAMPSRDVLPVQHGLGIQVGVRGGWRGARRGVG